MAQHEYEGELNSRSQRRVAKLHRGVQPIALARLEELVGRQRGAGRVKRPRATRTRGAWA